MYLVRIATASVSVSLSNLYPRFCSTSRSALELVTMPLCTTVNSALGSERSGWQFTTDGGPCVAQRVCAMLTCERNVLFVLMLDSAMRLRRPATLPTSLKKNMSPGLSPSMPMPAESYPRYSCRASPLQRISQMVLRS